MRLLAGSSPPHDTSSRSTKPSNSLFRAIDGQVKVGLQVDPELRRCPKRLREKPGRSRGDSSLAPNELIDALHGDPDMLGERHLGYFQRIEKLLQENLAGVGRNAMLRKHGYLQSIQW